MALLWHPATGAVIDVADSAAVHHHQAGWIPAADREAFLADAAARAAAPEPAAPEPAPAAPAWPGSTSSEGA
jgi:hypothetical protein